jgi:hypothetical protein
MDEINFDEHSARTNATYLAAMRLVIDIGGPDLWPEILNECWFACPDGSNGFKGAKANVTKLWWLARVVALQTLDPDADDDTIRQRAHAWDGRYRYPADRVRALIP